MIPWFSEVNEGFSGGFTTKSRYGIWIYMHGGKNCNKRGGHGVVVNSTWYGGNQTLSLGVSLFGFIWFELWVVCTAQLFVFPTS